MNNSKLERELWKLKCSISYKINSRCKRIRGIIFRDLVRVINEAVVYFMEC